MSLVPTWPLVNSAILLQPSIPSYFNFLSEKWGLDRLLVDRAELAAKRLQIAPEWNLTDQQKEKLRLELSAFANPPGVSFVVEVGADNANAFASELKDVLEKSGWRVGRTFLTSQTSPLFPTILQRILYKRIYKKCWGKEFLF